MYFFFFFFNYKIILNKYEMSNTDLMLMGESNPTTLRLIVTPTRIPGHPHRILSLTFLLYLWLYCICYTIHIVCTDVCDEMMLTSKWYISGRIHKVISSYKLMSIVLIKKIFCFFMYLVSIINFLFTNPHMYRMYP